MYGALVVKGYCGVSIPAEAAGWIDRLQLLEVELDDRLELVRQPGGFEVLRQVLQPAAVFLLQIDQSGHRCRPACRPWDAASGRCCGGRPGALLAQLGAASGLSLGRAHRDGADRRSGHAALLLSIVIVTFPRIDPRGARHWARNIAPTHLYSVDRWDPDHDAVMRIEAKLRDGRPIL